MRGNPWPDRASSPALQTSIWSRFINWSVPALCHLQVRYMEYLDAGAPSVACFWPGPVNEPFVCYDTAVESLLSSDTKLKLMVGILNLECSNSALQSWTSGFQIGSPIQQPAVKPAANEPRSSALLAKPAQVNTTQAFSRGDFMGFAMGRVMAAVTADSKLAAADAPAQLLQLSSRMFRFTARPPASSSQQAGQAAASKTIVVEYSDDAAVNPLGQVSPTQQCNGLQPGTDNINTARTAGSLVLMLSLPPQLMLHTI